MSSPRSDSTEPPLRADRAPRRILFWVWQAVGPLAYVAALFTYCLSVVLWIRDTPVPRGPAAMLLALPILAAELAFTRAYEVPARGYRRSVVMGLAARLVFVGVLAFFFVVRALQVKGTWDNWVTQDLSELPRMLRIFWAASPLPSGLLGLACAAAYFWWTARQRKARLTTTVLLPAVSTLALIVLVYYFPWAAIRGLSQQRPDFVVRVWTPSIPDHRVPREVMVTPDERYAVASFGSSFPIGSFAPSLPDPDLGPRCNPTANPIECGRNLALIDLQTGAVRTWAMTTVRRFYSEANDRFFVVPFRIFYLLDLRLDGSIQKYALPDHVAGERLEEVDETYYAADTGRVYLTSANNPVVVVWDVQAARVEQTLQLAGWNGISFGDSTMSIARSRSRRRLYVTVKGDHCQNVEVDETTMKPLRSFEPVGADKPGFRLVPFPPISYDIQVSPDEKSIYVGGFLTGEIWRFDADTLKHEATLEAPYQSRRIAFSPDGEQLFAASYLTGMLVVYDARTGERQDSFYVAPRLEGMHVAGGGLFLLSADGLYRIPLDELKRRAMSKPAEVPAVP